MKAPKYIIRALQERVNAAIKFNNADYVVSQWLEKNDIDVETYDTYGGVEAIVNPVDSQRRILSAIDKVEKKA